MCMGGPGCSGAKAAKSTTKKKGGYIHRNVGGRPTGVGASNFGKPKVSIRFSGRK